MNVLFICHSAVPAGAEISLLRLTSAMTSHKPIVVFTETGPMVDAFRARGCEVHDAHQPFHITRNDRSPLKILENVALMFWHGWKLGKKPEFKNIDVVIAYSFKALLVGWPIARRLRRPLVWSVHDRISPGYLGKVNAVLVRFVGRLLPDGYIANSEGTLATLWYDEKPHTVIYPSLDPDNLNKPIGTIRRNVPLVVALVGRLAEWKGQHIFIEAFDRALGASRARAVIVGGALFGEVDYEKRIRAQAAAANAAERIHFTGHVDDVAPYLREADILVHASTIPEPFGLVVIEGMAASCAVIATEPGGPEEIITNGVDGLLVQGGSVEEMSNAIRALANDTILRERLTRAGVRRASQFGAETQAKKLEGWLETWIGAHRSTGEAPMK